VNLPVFWTQTARNQLQGIYQYIAQNSERYAIRTVERIIIVAVIHGARDDVT